MEKVIEHLEQERSVLIKNAESINNELDILKEDAETLQAKRGDIIDSLVQIEKALRELHRSNYKKDN